MTAPPGPAPDPSFSGTEPTLPAPRWGVGDALVGWLVAEGLAVLGTGLVLGSDGAEPSMGQYPLDVVGRLTGHTFEATTTSLAVIAVLQLFLWVGLLGVPVFAARVKGNGVVSDYGLRFRAVD